MIFGPIKIHEAKNSKNHGKKQEKVYLRGWIIVSTIPLVTEYVSKKEYPF